MNKYLNPVRQPVYADVELPGSKSMCNRALLIASLASGKSILKNMLFSDDVEACLVALQSLGIKLQIDRDQSVVEVEGCAGAFPVKDAKIFTREAGTLTRFLIPLCAMQQTGSYYFSASERMMERPLAELMAVLESQGCEVEYHDKQGHMPFTLRPNGFSGGSESVCGKKSSQFLSGLLLAAPFAKKPLTLISETDHAQPYVSMTVSMMCSFGVSIQQGPQGVYKVPSEKVYSGLNYVMEPDVSTASYFWALAAICGGEVCVKHVSQSSQQGDLRFLDVMKEMGCDVSFDSKGTCLKRSGNLKGVSVNMRNFSDTFMTVAAVAAFAEGETYIKGLSHTRLQESDRVSAMSEGLRRLGIGVEETEDSIRIIPSKETYGAIVEGHNDHRIAMSLALIGLKVPDVIVRGAECVKKTCPDYFERMAVILNQEPVKG